MNEIGVVRRSCLAAVAVALALGACGGDDTSESTPTGSDGGNGNSTTDDADDGGDGGDGGEADASGTGDAVSAPGDAPPPGEAVAIVDGLDLAFDLPGALACSVSADSLTYSFRQGDNEVTLGAGVNRVDGGWMGSIALTIAEPSGEDGPIAYYPTPGELGILDQSLFTVDGDTVWYSGPMLKQPANDGSAPPPEDVGDGLIAATCP